MVASHWLASRERSRTLGRYEDATCRGSDYIVASSLFRLRVHFRCVSVDPDACLSLSLFAVVICHTTLVLHAYAVQLRYEDFFLETPPTP